MLSQNEITDLKKLAKDIRIETLKALGNLGFGHVGGSMSIAELLAVLYGKAMKYDAKNPKWADRDYLVLSKGHAGPALYATLALKGFIPLEELNTLNKGGTNLPSHCDMHKTKGIDATTGSLGQGISVAMGIALGHKIKKQDNFTYVVMGDGEIQEGQVWEGAMLASQHKLNKLIAFVDVNKWQLDAFTRDLCDIEDVEAKFQSFGWHTGRVDGHDCAAIYGAIEEAKQNAGDKPSVIVLDTVKGKGCSVAEKIWNHHITFTKEQADESIEALNACLCEGGSK